MLSIDLRHILYFSLHLSESFILKCIARSLKIIYAQYFFFMYIMDGFISLCNSRLAYKGQTVQCNF